MVFPLFISPMTNNGLQFSVSPYYHTFSFLIAADCWLCIGSSRPEVFLKISQNSQEKTKPETCNFI